MQICAVEQEIVTVGEDLPGSGQMRHQLGKVPLAEKMRRDRTIPEQCAGVGARGRREAFEQPPAGLPGRGPTAPTRRAAICDERKASHVSRYEHSDVGMKHRSAVQEIIGAQWAAVGNITLKFVERESATVGNKDDLVALSAPASAEFLPIVVRAVQKCRKFPHVAK